MLGEIPVEGDLEVILLHAIGTNASRRVSMNKAGNSECENAHIRIMQLRKTRKSCLWRALVAIVVACDTAQNKVVGRVGTCVFLMATRDSLQRVAAETAVMYQGRTG